LYRLGLLFKKPWFCLVLKRKNFIVGMRRIRHFLDQSDYNDTPKKEPDNFKREVELLGSLFPNIFT